MRDPVDSSMQISMTTPICVCYRNVVQQCALPSVACLLHIQTARYQNDSQFEEFISCYCQPTEQHLSALVQEVMARPVIGPI